MIIKNFSNMKFWQTSQPLILGSSSSTRRAILEGVGIPVEVKHPHVDEQAIVTSLLTERRDPNEIAVALAHAKAEAVVRKHPDRLVLSADQTLDLENSLLMKPKDRTSAALQLSRLRGKTHYLHSAVVLRRGETVLWAGFQSATMRMRNFSDEVLLTYLEVMGDKLLTSVGCYQIEGFGALLFDEVEGEHTTILGLPLYPVLHALRDAGSLKT